MREDNCKEDAIAAMKRMARAAKRKTGCHLTANMIRCLKIGCLGELMEDPNPPDPRAGRDET